MLKPLLRTIPTMSGNVKLACNILDYKETDINTYETDIRYAKLLPISSDLYQRKIETQLLGSSWEYDLKKFYSVYNDVFFTPYFKYNTEEILKVDKTIIQRLRNTDFEMGVKRISYVKNGAQYAFFAPFYFESLEDLPRYFQLTANIKTTAHHIVKTIKINITDNNTSKTNYLYHYLTKYAKNIDSNVCFMLPDSKQAAFYGIDLVNGGFVKSVDNGVANLYSVQTTIHNFDATICTGFRRNKIAMKQVMPLAFYFDIRDVMTASELKIYRNAEIEFSGYYVNKNGITCPWYDFNIDYDFWKESVLQLNSTNGLMQWFPGSCENIMDTTFPSLNENRYVKYQFSNKLTGTYCRWKLKYSSDEHPYITNISPAFSKNQNSNYKYGQYPAAFSAMDALAVPILDNDAYHYNMIFPLSTNVHYYNLYNSNSASKYKNIMNNYCLNWFNTIDKIDDTLFHTKHMWEDVVDNCVYYNGILYDLSNIYAELVDPVKIDKFGMFVKLNTNFMSELEISKLKFSDYTLDRQYVVKSLAPNCLSNLQLLNWGIGDPSLNYKNYLWDNEEYRGSQQNVANKDSLTVNKIFTYSENNTGHYIDFADYAMDYYELNKYYEWGKVNSYIEYIKDNFFELYEPELVTTYANVWNSEYKDIILNDAFGYLPVATNPSSYMINSYELLPISRSYDISYFDGEYDKNDINNYMYSYGFSYMLNLNQYCAYEWYYPIDNTSYTSYYYIPIEGLKDAYGNFIPETTKEYDFVADNLYVASSDNYGIKSPSHTNYFNAYTQFTTSYFSAGKSEYTHALYGNTLYNKKTFIKASDINKLSYEEFSPTYLHSFCDNDYSGRWMYRDILNTETETYRLLKCCIYSQAILASAINSYLSTLDEYEFNPVLHNNGSIYTANVFTKRYKNIGKFYGSTISYSELPNDKDIIWADRYNLNAIFKKYTNPKEMWSYIEPVYDEFRDAYNYINRTYTHYYTYDYIYDVNTYTYSYSYIRQYNAPEIVTYEYDNKGLIEYYSLNKHNYAEFYARFLNKIHIYYWYGELVKDEQLKYPDNWPIDWKRNIFIKRRVLVHTDEGLKVQDEYIPLVEAGYMFVKRVDENWFLSFKRFYEHIREYEEGIFYFEGNEGEKFELVYKDIFFRVNKTLWNIIGCEDIHYKDIYLYRVLRPEEYNTQRINEIHMRYVGNDFWNSYQKYYKDIDYSLTPLFYDVHEQEQIEESVYANYKLNNITPVNFSWPEYDEKGEIIKYHLDSNYRYNANDTHFMVNITDEEREWFNIDKTYDEYSYCSSGFGVDVNSLDYNEQLHMSTYHDPHNNLNYGFYVINVNLDNTSNSFRVDAQTTMTSKSNTIERYDYLNNIKSIHYINGVNISENPEYVVKLFKNIAPFININLLENLNDISTIIKPNVLNISMIYNQQLVDNLNNSTEITIYKGDAQKYTKQNLYRYTHNIVPYITERNILSNYYFLKLKNVDKTLLDDGKFNSIGDSIVYKKIVQIGAFTPHNIYTLSNDTKEIKNYNNIDYKYYPLEYKHFNASKYINIESYFEINVDGKYTYDELLQLQDEQKVINTFTSYINNGRTTKFNEDEILFLYKKYKVEYDSKPVGLTYNRTEKLYTMIYKFSLL